MGNRCSIQQSEEINCWLEQSPENRLYRPFHYFWATLYIYTERQKKHHFFRATHIIIQSISMNHNWAHISYNTPYQAHLTKCTFAWVYKKKNEIARGNFSKITETARLPGTELGTDNSQYGGYITRLWNWKNSYWMFWIGGLSWRFSASSFCDFWKVTFCDFISFSPYWQKESFNFTDVCHKENYSLSVSKYD